jgi:hypothetical protein
MKSTYKAAEVAAPEFALLAIEAHGGLDRWQRFSTVSVHGISRTLRLRSHGVLRHRLSDKKNLCSPTGRPFRP